MATFTRNTTISKTVNAQKLLNLVEGLAITEIDRSDIDQTTYSLVNVESFAANATAYSRELYWDGRRSSAILSARTGNPAFKRLAATQNCFSALNIGTTTITRGSLLRPINTSQSTNGAIKVIPLNFSGEVQEASYCIGVAGVDIESGMVGYGVNAGMVEARILADANLDAYKPGVPFYAASGTTGAGTISEPFGSDTSVLQVGRVIEAPTVSGSVGLVDVYLQL